MTKKTRDIVSDFANNDMPAEVQEQFRCWLDEHAGDGVAEEQLLEEWNSAKLGPVNGAAYEQSFERLMRSMPEVSPVPAPKTGRLARLAASWRRMAAVAAVCCAALGLGALGARMLLKPENGVFVVTGEDSKGRFVLPDGTHIWLNAGSVLRYYGDLTGRRRVVELDGEGFFKVRHDADRPFILRMEDMNIEVLGTEFDVINYAEFATTEAILCSGSIRAYGGRLPAPVTLKPGDRLVFDKKEGRASRSRVSTQNYSQWMGGSLSFDDTPLADILTNLERWYAVEIDAPEAWTRQVRMSFKLIRNESIEEILKAMSLVVEMDYVCAGRHITIIPQQPKNS